MSDKEKNSGLDRKINREDGVGSTSRSPLVEFQQIPGNVEDKEEATSFKTKGHPKQEGNTRTSLPFYKLFTFADSTDILLMFLGTVGAIGNGICMPLMNLLFAKSISAFGENANSKERVVQEVIKVCLNFVYVGVGAGLSGFIEVTCWIITGERQAARIRSLFLKTILRQDISFFDTETSIGEITERMSSDTVLIQDAMGEKVGRSIHLGTTFIGSFVIAFIKGWLLTLVMLTSMPAIIISGSIMSTLISKLASKGQTAYSLAATVAEQTIGSIRTVASYIGEKQAISKYNKSLVKAYKSGVKEGLAAGLGFGTVDFVLYSSYALAVWYGGKLILERGYSGGEVLSVLFCVTTGAMSLGQASPCVSAFATGQAAAYKLFEAIERKPQIDAYDSRGVKLDDIRGDIELRDVYFSYPSRPLDTIFNGFSLLIPRGMTAAMVGQSGSGKSTVISLIERFYDPQAGEVLIDGINLEEFQLKWIREKIGLVNQEPVMFTCSIKDNIAYGKQGATIEEIRTAVEFANAAKFIDKLPQGLDTMVGEHGTQLSGGQKQRIAIARAILKNPRILLLDEATSALDAESERIVQEALDKIMINRTTVVVAHRLSTVRNADMIAVIHRGKIVEKGTHSELTKDPDGAYSQLIKMQEMSKAKEQNAATHQNKSEIILDSRRPSSQMSSPLRYIGWESPKMGNISPYSFHAAMNLSIGTGVVEAAPAEPHTSASESSKLAPAMPLRRLAYLNKPEILVLLLGAIAAGVVGITLPFLGIILSSVANSFFEPPHELRKDSKFWALMYLCLAAACFLGHSFKSYLFAVAGCKLIRRIRSMCFEKVVYMEVSWFDEPENSSGALGSRLSTDAASLRSMVGDALSLFVQNIVSLIAALVVAFGTNWQLALIVLALLPFLVFQGFVSIKFFDGFGADSKKLYGEASQVANDAVGSIRTVSSFCVEEKVMELYNKKCEGPLKLGTKQGLIGGGAFGMSLFFTFVVYAILFYVGARFVEAGRMGFSDVLRVLYVLAYTAMAICQSGFLSPNASKSGSAVTSIFALLDRKSKIDASDESGQTIENVKGEIEFHHVQFKYPTRPDVQIFNNICLAIPSGKTVALVGESGSGKSTVISLLLRFYDPDSGCITLDGIEIQKLQLKWLRKQMGLVSQEPVLFNDTIRANIAYGKEENATEAEITAAAELANAHRFISGLKQGYDTMVGERGAQLSGGQKQRVAIARAIVKSPKILLLDEATSALDAESERVVQDALDRVMVGRTTVVVAHRLSTIKNADIIAVVKNGVIAEEGNHETLVNMRGGVYASLVALYTNASS